MEGVIGHHATPYQAPQRIESLPRITPARRFMQLREKSCTAAAELLHQQNLSRTQWRLELTLRRARARAW